MRAGQKSNTISVRLDVDEQRLLQRVARRRKTSVSNVVREAVNLLAREEMQSIRPFDEIADLIGVVHDLPADLSEQTGEQFAEIVRQKAGRRT